MEFIVGFTLALFVCGATAWLGMDRDRVFYPAVLIVVATYYVLFAVVDGRNEVLLSEMAIAAVFTALAVAGFKRAAWIAVAALAGHGLMDLFHHDLVHNTGVPQGWPGFCLAFDVTAALFFAVVIALRAGSMPNPQHQGAEMNSYGTTISPVKVQRPARSGA